MSSRVIISYLVKAIEFEKQNYQGLVETAQQ